jgi:hypothetical protein
VQLRELLAERDAEIAVPREQNSEIAVLREALAMLQAQVEDLAAQVKRTPATRRSRRRRTAGEAGVEVAAREVRPPAGQA